MSALPPKADMDAAVQNVRLVPEADIRQTPLVGRSFNTNLRMKLVFLETEAR